MYLLFSLLVYLLVFGTYMVGIYMGRRSMQPTIDNLIEINNRLKKKLDKIQKK